MATTGMAADFRALRKAMAIRLKDYEYKQRCEAPTSAVAALLSYSLYMKRHFFYYANNLCCGLNEEGDGVVYGYDVIGSTEPKTYGC